MALRKLTHDVATDALVASELVTEGRMIDNTIRRHALSRGWSVEGLSDHLNAGKTAHTFSDDGKFRYTLYFTNSEE